MLAQPADELLGDPMAMDTTEPADWTAYVDPEEPRYCICNEVSYGDMVACDNASVSVKVVVVYHVLSKYEIIPLGLVYH